jgi:hypothetical protein
MPTNRFNYSDDFVLNNGKVGINSASPQEKLDVVGITKAENLSVVGVSSLTGYEGFLRANHNIAENTSLEGGQGITGSLSGEIVIGTGVTVTGIASATSGQGYIDSLKVYNTFTVPVGLTADRPTAPKPGQLYYNKDFASIEFFDGDRWRQVDNTTQRGRGVFAGGSGLKSIEYITISSLGNSQNFGNLSVLTNYSAACSSSTRGMFGGGWTPAAVLNEIEYITLSSEGNSIDFGDLSQARGEFASCSSSTRGLWMSGELIPYSNVNTIDYVEISTIGNAQDFGDLTESKRVPGSASSPTKGICVGGILSSPLLTMEIFTISNKSNSVNFGNLTVARFAAGECSSGTRAVFAGGANSGAGINVIDYITLSSLGNAIDFGNLSVSSRRCRGFSNKVRGVFGGGDNPSTINVMQYITIASTGNSQDFGDLGSSRNTHSACSDSHGGLGGF